MRVAHLFALAAQIVDFLPQFLRFGHGARRQRAPHRVHARRVPLADTPRRARRAAKPPDPQSGGCALRDSPENLLRAAGSSTHPFELRLFERGFGLIHQRAERGRIGHRHIGEDFAVQFDAGFLQAVHELAVGNLGRAAAAPMRTIHSERKSRFFRRRPT